jgi:putative pyruvate formate lyase activating enzyme
LAIEKGLRIPLVYNCGGYEQVETLKLLEGIFDIYMPDFKFASSEVAQRLAQAPDYPQRAKEAITEMHRQVGDLILDEEGLAVRGLLVRHLVLPNHLAGSRQIFEFLAGLSKDTYLNVMAQYRPCGRASEHPDLNRGLKSEEHREAVKWSFQAGLHRLDKPRPRFLWV